MLRSFWRQDAPGPGRVPGVEDDPLRACMQHERFGVVVTRGEKWRAHPEYEQVFQNALDAIDQRLDRKSVV